MPRKKKPPTEPYNTGRALTAVSGGRGYGERQASEQALQEVPLSPRPGADPQAAPQGPPDFAAVLAAAQASPSPNGGLLNQPTARPDEPITAGLSTGPGPGPEILGPSDPDLATLRAYLPMLELAANQPGASVSTRNLVRRLRGAMPPAL